MESLGKEIREEIAELPFTGLQFLSILSFALLSVYLWWYAVCGRLSTRRVAEQDYEALYKRREDVQHHIDWCRARNEHAEARALEGSAIKLDRKLEEYEERLARMTGRKLR